METPLIITNSQVKLTTERLTLLLLLFKRAVCPVLSMLILKKKHLIYFCIDLFSEEST